MNELPIVSSVEFEGRKDNGRSWLRVLREKYGEIHNTAAPVPASQAGACGRDCKTCGVAEKKMKPRIKWHGKLWGCNGAGFMAYGYTPEAAYREWQFQCRRWGAA